MTMMTGKKTKHETKQVRIYGGWMKKNINKDSQNS